jgi:hypothetical protein
MILISAQSCGALRVTVEAALPGDAAKDTEHACAQFGLHACIRQISPSGCPLLVLLK